MSTDKEPCQKGTWKSLASYCKTACSTSISLQHAASLFSQQLFGVLGATKAVGAKPHMNTQFSPQICRLPTRSGTEPQFQRTGSLSPACALGVI